MLIVMLVAPAEVVLNTNRAAPDPPVLNRDKRKYVLVSEAASAVSVLTPKKPANNTADVTKDKTRFSALCIIFSFCDPHTEDSVLTLYAYAFIVKVIKYVG